MAGSEILMALLLVAVCVIAGRLVVPRAWRRWSAATKPTDERLEYAAHLGDRIDRGPSEAEAAERERAGYRELEGTPIKQA